MLEAPPDLTAELILATLREHWGLAATEAEYAAIGHGSHNWTVRTDDGTKLFVKADRAEPAFRESAHQTAAELRDGGLDSVHAAIRSRSGELRRQVGPWKLTVFPFINGRNPDFADSAQRCRIAETIGRLHSCPPMPNAPRWAPGLWRPELDRLMAAGLDAPWDSGPYAARAQALFLAGLPGVRELLELHDSLSARLAASDQAWVITHGEPHGGNTMLDDSGQLRLIDCDDLMVAPRERDLWLLLYVAHDRRRADDDSEILRAYQRTAGPAAPRRDVIELIRADWHLSEISAYVHDFSRPHHDTEDHAAHWRTLNSYLPVSQNWPPSPGRFSEI
ncbi:phosphotransferase enzyme family protein [Microlunatus sp. GCM10028923]|uniref:phosphotransferase enzyme family protein n=1 Tax=Microlunatus sp. GCM10028923 TaxID=3273400 RepID=UPI0036174850